VAACGHEQKDILMSDSYQQDDEISLFDIYNFFKEGWKTIVTTTLVGGAIGVGASFVIPEQFLATGTIETGRVNGNDIEGIAVLAEKMRLPTYYSNQTLEICEVNRTADPGQTLAKALNPNVARNSSFVTVSFKSKNTETSAACLNAVLGDVVQAQSILKKPILEKSLNDLDQAKQRLETARVKHGQELKLNQEQLQALKAKLKTAQKFVDRFADNAARFDFKDEQFSASSLLLATIINKQNEVKDLQVQINNLEMKVAASLTGREDELLGLEKQFADTERGLLSPMTESAKFSAPIYNPPNKVEPKRSLIVVISVLAGGFLGLMLLALRRAIKHIKQQSEVPPLQA
jgi:chain length determinant protein (polysaccharide antigen chain regulator)